jgi:hypothetical protein
MMIGLDSISITFNFQRSENEERGKKQIKTTTVAAVVMNALFLQDYANEFIFIHTSYFDAANPKTVLLKSEYACECLE